MKVSFVLLIVVVGAVLGYPAELQVESENPESVATIEEQADPIPVDNGFGLVRDKRQWGGGGGGKILYLSV